MLFRRVVLKTTLDPSVGWFLPARDQESKRISRGSRLVPCPWGVGVKKLGVDVSKCQL